MADEMPLEDNMLELVSVRGHLMKKIKPQEPKNASKSVKFGATKENR